MKSYHSSALPITAAAIWTGFGAALFLGIDAAVIIGCSSEAARRQSGFDALRGANDAPRQVLL